VVRQLESGEVPLDESISLYERGERCAGLSGPARCRQARIERIVAGPDGAPASLRRWMNNKGEAKDGCCNR
jgi:exodeoxyribonuclease VII small subunit